MARHASAGDERDDDGDDGTKGGTGGAGRERGGGGSESARAVGGRSRPGAIAGWSPDEEQQMTTTIIIENFTAIKETKFYTKEFAFGGHHWRLMLFPFGNNGNETHPPALSVFVECVDPPDAPPPRAHLLPARGGAADAAAGEETEPRALELFFALRVLNHVHEEMHAAKDHLHKFHRKEADRGWANLIKRSLIDVANSEYLDANGALHIETHLRRVPPTGRELVAMGYNSREATGFVGLKNQGATCYMNSFLQTLFSLGPFRSVVYNLPFDEEAQTSKSIPISLARLFYELQYSKDAASTKSLTNSFGWVTADAFIQHDVQEFQTKLLDKLDDHMKGTPLEGRINQLFQGRTQSFTECINVDYTSKREEDFLTIILQVRPTVYAALRQELAIERLDGDNKYRVDGYDEKQEAWRGCRYLKFPAVMQIHLGRFSFNFMTGQAEKKNGRFEFPTELDLRRFQYRLDGKGDPSLFSAEALQQPSADSADAEAEAKAAARAAADSLEAIAADRDRVVNGWAYSDADAPVYYLQAVLVHSGVSSGGHYYAFLRPRPTSDEAAARGGPGSCWFKFDDEIVMRVPREDAVDNTFGGKRYLRQFNTASAYMLVYVHRNAAERRSFASRHILDRQLSLVEDAPADDAAAPEAAAAPASGDKNDRGGGDDEVEAVPDPFDVLLEVEVPSLMRGHFKRDDAERRRLEQEKKQAHLYGSVNVFVESRIVNGKYPRSPVMAEFGSLEHARISFKKLDRKILLSEFRSLVESKTGLEPSRQQFFLYYGRKNLTVRAAAHVTQDPNDPSADCEVFKLDESSNPLEMWVREEPPDWYERRGHLFTKIVPYSRDDDSHCALAYMAIKYFDVYRQAVFIVGCACVDVRKTCRTLVSEYFIECAGMREAACGERGELDAGSLLIQGERTAEGESVGLEVWEEECLGRDKVKKLGPDRTIGADSALECGDVVVVQHTISPALRAAVEDEPAIAARVRSRRGERRDPPTTAEVPATFVAASSGAFTSDAIAKQAIANIRFYRAVLAHKLEKDDAEERRAAAGAAAADDGEYEVPAGPEHSLLACIGASTATDSFIGEHVHLRLSACWPGFVASLPAGDAKAPVTRASPPSVIRRAFVASLSDSEVVELMQSAVVHYSLDALSYLQDRRKNNTVVLFQAVGEQGTDRAVNPNLDPLRAAGPLAPVRLRLNNEMDVVDVCERLGAALGVDPWCLRLYCHSKHTDEPDLHNPIARRDYGYDHPSAYNEESSARASEADKDRRADSWRKKVVDFTKDVRLAYYRVLEYTLQDERTHFPIDLTFVRQFPGQHFSSLSLTVLAEKDGNVADLLAATEARLEALRREQRARLASDQRDPDAGGVKAKGKAGRTPDGDVLLNSDDYPHGPLRLLEVINSTVTRVLSAETKVRDLVSASSSSSSSYYYSSSHTPAFRVEYMPVDEVQPLAEHMAYLAKHGVDEVGELASGVGDLSTDDAPRPPGAASYRGPRVIWAFHFSNNRGYQIDRHSTPFSIVLKPGEKLADFRKRVQERLGMVGQSQFDRWRFACQLVTSASGIAVGQGGSDAAQVTRPPYSHFTGGSAPGKKVFYLEDDDAVVTDIVDWNRHLLCLEHRPSKPTQSKFGWARREEQGFAFKT